MDDLLPPIRDAIRRVFGDDEIEVGLGTSATDVEGWDSLMHINVIIAVEKEFGVKFATAEISNLKEDGKTVGDFLELVAHKLHVGP